MSIISISGTIGSGKDTAARTIQYIISDLKDKNTTSLEDAIANPLENDWWLEDSSDWQVRKFAGALKQIASILTGIPRHKFEDQEFKKTELGPEWDRWSYYSEMTGEETQSYTSEAEAIKAKEDFLNDPRYSKGTKESNMLICLHNKMTVREFLQKIGTEAIRDGLHKNAWINAMFADYTPQRPHDGPTRDLKLPNWIITDTRFNNEFSSVLKHKAITLFIERGDSNTGTHPSEVEMMSFKDKCNHIIDNNGTLQDLRTKLEVILKQHKII